MGRDRRRARIRRRRAWRRLRRRIGRGGAVGLGALAACIATAGLLDRRRDGAAVAELVEFARSERIDPTALVVSAAKSHRIILLGDVHRLAEPKRIAARAIEALTQGPGLDAVVLELDASLQPLIDRYLESDPEDASLLMAEPRALRGQGGAAQEFLGIFRTVWRLNRTLEPSRRIRIVAANLAGWPPGRAVPHHAAAALYARRDAHMADRIEAEVLRRKPRARILVFVGGYHVLGHGHARLHLAGGAPVTITWLGARLRARHPTDVYSIVVDGAARPVTPGTVTSYRATRAFDVFRTRLADIEAPFGLRIDDHFDFLGNPVRESAGPGLTLEIFPADDRFRDVADGYIYLGVRHGVVRGS